MPSTRQQQQQPAGDGTNLADILERVLDKGIVIAGDVQINLLDIELLTIKLRLVVASVDRAKEMGIDWWERDPTLSAGHRELEDENQRLRERIEALENGTRSLNGTGGDDDQHDEDAVAEAADEDEDDGPDDEAADDAEDADFEDAEDADVEDEDGDEDRPDDEPDEAADDEPEPEPAPRRRTATAARPRKRRS